MMDYSKPFDIVFGAAGFLGYSLVEQLVKRGHNVVCIVKPGSEHNCRLENLPDVFIVELEMDRYDELPDTLSDEVKNANIVAAYYLTWSGKRYDYEEQFLNLASITKALDSVHSLQCKRFIATGSQAEYGATTKVQTEDMMPAPFCDYGAAKVAACFLSKRKAEELGIEWIWGRVFSLYGKFEPHGRLFPDMCDKFCRNEPLTVSSCRQNWNYLDARDAADALISLSEKGVPGEIYNIAHSESKPLSEYVELIKKELRSDSEIVYGNDPEPFVSLQPSVEKIVSHTGWHPERSITVCVCC